MTDDLQAPGHDPLFNGSWTWRVTKGHRPPSYLFGSVHQMDTTKVSLPIAALEGLLAETGALCVEVDVRDIDPASIRPPLQPSGESRDDEDQGDESRGDDIAALLGSEDYERLRRILSESAHGAELVPMLDAVPLPLLTMAVALAQQQHSEYFTESDFEIESHFVNSAAAGEWPIHTLETIEEQVELLTLEKPLLEQVTELKEAIALHEDPEAPDLYRRYADEDLRLLPEEAFFTAEMSERNARMVDRLVPVLDSGPALVIVGAAHLPYETGMLALLRRRGYEISPHPLRAG